MISAGARHFARFATKQTPKHSFKAFASNACTILNPAGTRFVPLVKSPSIARLASLLHPIPPSMTNSALGAIVMSARSLSTSTSNASEVLEPAQKLESVIEGTTIEAIDDVEAILQSSRGRTLIMDFHAGWCGPCRVLGPVLVQAVKENKKCILLKIDVDAHPEAAAKFGVTSLPTVIGYKDGVNLGTFMGARDKLFVSKFISQVTSEEKTGSA